MRIDSSCVFIAFPKLGVVFLQQSFYLGSFFLVFDNTVDFAVLPIKLEALVQYLWVIGFVISEDT